VVPFTQRDVDNFSAFAGYAAPRRPPPSHRDPQLKDIDPSLLPQIPDLVGSDSNVSGEHRQVPPTQSHPHPAPLRNTRTKNRAAAVPGPFRRGPLPPASLQNMRLFQIANHAPAPADPPILPPLPSPRSLLEGGGLLPATCRAITPAAEHLHPTAPVLSGDVRGRKRAPVGNRFHCLVTDPRPSVPHYYTERGERMSWPFPHRPPFVPRIGPPAPEYQRSESMLALHGGPHPSVSLWDFPLSSPPHANVLVDGHNLRHNRHNRRPAT